jgi:etoposide-induced 2.4 mRNA
LYFPPIPTPRTGFGAPLVIATSFFSFYVGAAALAVLFPLFILVAMDSEPGEALAGVPAAEQDVGQVRGTQPCSTLSRPVPCTTR